LWKEQDEIKDSSDRSLSEDQGLTAVINSDGQILPVFVTLLMLSGVPFCADAAQPDKTKAQKAPPVKEDPGP
jgi:hypothetical protein